MGISTQSTLGGDILISILSLIRLDQNILVQNEREMPIRTFSNQADKKEYKFHKRGTGLPADQSTQVNTTRENPT